MGDASAWFFAPELAGVGGRIVLDAREAKHAAGAKRLSVGDAVTVFDGRGGLGRSRFCEVGPRSVVVEVVSIEHHEPLLPQLWLASALPKGDRQSVMLSMASQLGIAMFSPLRCARSVAKAGSAFRDRAERICIEACKQSRQAWVPEIAAPVDVASFAANASSRNWSLLIAHPEGAPPNAVSAATKSTALMIGPEGGFTDQEVADAAARGAAVVSLGPAVFRIETAAAALLGYLRLRSIQ